MHLAGRASGSCSLNLSRLPDMWRRQAAASVVASASRCVVASTATSSGALAAGTQPLRHASASSARRTPASAGVPGEPQRRHFAGRAGAGGPHFQGFGYPGGFPGGAPVNSDKLYKLLEVDKNASEADIKAAYKKQALKHHPDRGGDANIFKDVSKAYEVLSDPQKRQVYDQFGEEGLEGAASGHGAAAPGMDPFEIFSSMFGFPGGQKMQRGRPVTQDSLYELQLTLEEFYTGTSRSIKFARNTLCKTCSGAGGKDRKNCQRCGGTGVTVSVQQNGFFTQSFQSSCASCGGKGYNVKTECSDCKGKCTVSEHKTFSVDIEPGLPDGQEFHFRGQADEAPGHDPGDVVIVAKEKSHKTFKRMNDALLMTKKISLAEALCGFEFTTVFLDGKDLVIRSKPGQVVKPGEMMRIPGRGMPRKHGQKPGDLFIQIEVDFPSSVPAESRDKLAEMLGGKALAEEKPPGSAVAEPVSSSQAAELRHRLLQASQQRRGGSGDQQMQCAQQ